MQTSDRVQIRMPVALKEALAAHPYAKPHTNGRSGGAALAALRLLLDHFGMEYVDPHEEQAKAAKAGDGHGNS